MIGWIAGKGSNVSSFHHRPLILIPVFVLSGLETDNSVLYYFNAEPNSQIYVRDIMKSHDAKFSKSQLVDCVNESDDSAEICRLALKKIRALEKKIERISTTRKTKTV
jgi:hypothetical protein